MVPCFKFKNEDELKYIIAHLKDFGYKPASSSYIPEKYREYIFLDWNSILGNYCVGPSENVSLLSRTLLTNAEEFLEEAAKLQGFSYKRKDIVTAEDLKGDIADFPIDVVQAMVKYQMDQGNKPNVKVFQTLKMADKHQGGFSWNETEEGDEFWNEIININNFYLFFNRPTNLKDLVKPGMVVEDTKGNRYLTMKVFYFGEEEIIFMDKTGFNRLSSYNDNLENSCKIHTINKIYDSGNRYGLGLNILSCKDLKLIWERTTTLTKAEIENRLGIPNGTLRII